MSQLDSFGNYMQHRVEAAVHRAVLAEREACAALADRAAPVHAGEDAGACLRHLAADVRARGRDHAPS